MSVSIYQYFWSLSVSSASRKKVKNKFTWHWHVEGCRLCTICLNKNAKYFNSIFMSCCGKNSACFLNKHLTFRVYAKHELYRLVCVFERVSQFLVDVTTLYTICRKDTTFQHNILDVKWVVKSCLQDNPPAAVLPFSFCFSIFIRFFGNFWEFLGLRNNSSLFSAKNM